MPPTHAHSHFLTNTGYIGGIPKEGKPGKLFFLPMLLFESWRPPSFHVFSIFSPLHVLLVLVVKFYVLDHRCIPLSASMLFLSPPPPSKSVSHPRTLAFLPFPCWAVCHGGEVRRHVILLWCVERIQPGVPRHRMTTNQTGFQQHEKYIDPSARLEMASYTV